MDSKIRENLVKNFLKTLVIEAELKQQKRELDVAVRILESDLCDIQELCTAQDEFLCLENVLEYIGDIVTEYKRMLNIREVTILDFDRDFIPLGTRMPAENEEVYVLFDSGKICLSRWCYSKARKRLVFAYEDFFGRAVAWLPMEEE